MSHRALILGAMATGTTRVRGLLEGADILSTAGAMRSFGARVEKDGDVWTIEGGPWTTPNAPIDLGNAGTGVRLVMGAASGYALRATFTGDASLSSRPMGRVLEPLRDMGVRTDGADGDRLPVTLTSDGALRAIDYSPPMASAQVKSCILLAGLNTSGTTVVREIAPTRDHTENMLAAFGADLGREGSVVSIAGPQSLSACEIDIPGDPSSAAFAVVAALIVPGSDVVVENVMLNPTRTGLFETLVEMGADIETSNVRASGGEAVADFRVRASDLIGVTVPAHRAASMIDEYPILAVAAAFAQGMTHMPGIGEMRVKESDRIAATLAMLRGNGVRAEDGPDSLSVTGGAVAGGGTAITHHDHRIAMSALVLGLGSARGAGVDDAEMIGTSYPEFFRDMEALGARFD